jgi:hypothetical protein
MYVRNGMMDIFYVHKIQLECTYVGNIGSRDTGVTVQNDERTHVRMYACALTYVQ